MFSYPRKLQGGLWTCGLALGRGFTSSKYDPQVMPLLAQKCNDCGRADVGTRIRQHCSGLEPVRRHAPRRGKGLGGEPIFKAAETDGTVLWPSPSVRPINTANQQYMGSIRRDDIQEAHLEVQTI
jgi:hypothetical protein